MGDMAWVYDVGGGYLNTFFLSSPPAVWFISRYLPERPARRADPNLRSLLAVGVGALLYVLALVDGPEQSVTWLLRTRPMFFFGEMTIASSVEVGSLGSSPSRLTTSQREDFSKEQRDKERRRRKGGRE